MNATSQLSHRLHPLSLSLLAATFGLAFPSIGDRALQSQEQSVVPESLNARFLDEAVDPSTFVSMFESDGREIYAHRHQIIDALELTAGMEVADIGAGTGFFARMIAQRVGPQGRVYAIDISPNMLEHIEQKNLDLGVTNVVARLGQARSSGLEPESVDLVFLCDTYHHFEYPEDMLRSIWQALRPGGRLVVVDFERVEGVSPAFAMSHLRAGKGTFTDEIRDRSFDFVDEVPMMKEQYVLRFRKRP